MSLSLHIQYLPKDGKQIKLVYILVQFLKICVVVSWNKIVCW